MAAALSKNGENLATQMQCHWGQKFCFLNILVPFEPTRLSLHLPFSSRKNPIYWERKKETLKQARSQQTSLSWNRIFLNKKKNPSRKPQPMFKWKHFIGVFLSQSVGRSVGGVFAVKQKMKKEGRIHFQRGFKNPLNTKNCGMLCTEIISWVWSESNLQQESCAKVGSDTPFASDLN